MVIFVCCLQSEYVSARDKRRKFVSGFSGSAGQFNFTVYLILFEVVIVHTESPVVQV